MSGEDLIFRALVKAGIEIDQADEARLRSKLAGLGQVLGDEGSKALSAQAVELLKLQHAVKREADRMERAARRDFDPKTLNPAERKALTDAFNVTETYRKQLADFIGTINKAGKANADPVFKELRSIEAVFAKLNATARNVTPLIDSITQAQRANAEQLRRNVAAERRDQSRQIRQQVLERNRTTLNQTDRAGRRTFATGARTDFLSITSTDAARQAAKFADGELKIRQEFWKQINEKFGNDSKEAKRAAADVDVMAQAVSRLRERTLELRDAESLQRTQKGKAEALARTEANIAASRARRGKQERVGRSLFIKEGAFNADLENLQGSDKAAKMLRFLKGELVDVVAKQKALNAAFGEGSDQAQRAGKASLVYSDFIGRLERRIESLKTVEAAKRKLDNESERLAKQSLRREEARQVKEDILRRDRDVQNLVNPGGREAFSRGYRSRFSSVTDLAEAKRALDFTKAELKTRREIEKVTKDRFGAESGQAQQAERNVNRLASAYQVLTDRVRALADVQSVANKNQLDAKRAQDKILETRRTGAIDRDRAPRAYSLFDRSRKSTDFLNNQRDVRTAMSAGNRELQRLQVQQKAISVVFGETGKEYRDATAEVKDYTRAIAALEARLETLRATQGKEEALLGSRRAGKSWMNPEGRKAYTSAKGNLGSLEGEERIQARNYAQARLAEARRSAQTFGQQFGQQSTQAQAAANAVAQYEAALRSLGGAAQTTGQQMGYLSNVFKMFLKYAVIYQSLYAIVAAVFALGRAMIDLQTEMLEIQAVTGSTDAQMNQLADTVSLVARNSKFSLLELTKAAKVLAQAGVPIDQLNTSLRATADFAAATGSNLEVAADLLSTTRSVFKELSDDVIANQLAKAINVSKLTAEDLKTILSLGAQTAKSFNLTSEQFLSAVATLRNAGLKASTVATGLRQGMLEIFSPDAQLVKALQERYRAMGENLGAEAVRARFYSFTKARAPLIAALNELRRLGFNDEGAMTLSRSFDVRSSNAIKAMISNLEELAANESRITFGRGAAEGATTTIDGLNASFTRLLSTIQSFSYSRSEGVLGFFTEVIQGIDQALQKLDEYDLRQRAKGEKGLPSVGELLLGGAPRFVVTKAYENTIGRFTNNEDDPEKALDKANASGRLLNIEQERVAQFDKAANAWDISAAQIGEATGQGAQMLVETSRRADDLRASIQEVFGNNMLEQQEALSAVAKSYASLSFTQREARLEELREKFPRMAAFTNQELDRALFGVAELTDETNGALQGFIEELNNKLVKANEVIRSLGGQQPVTPEQIEAVLFNQIVAQSGALQAVLEGSSKEAVDMQLGLLQQAQQTLAGALQAAGQADPFEAEAKRRANAFIDRIKAIALTTDRKTATADISAAVTALSAEFQKLDAVTINKLQTIQGLIFDAANEASNLKLQGMMLTAVGRLQSNIDDRSSRLIEKTAERSKTGQELVNPTLRDPGFIAYLKEAYPLNTPDLASVKAYAGPNSTGIPLQEFQADTLLSQAATKFVTDYNEIRKRQVTIEKEIAEETAKRLGLERNATQATQAYDEARTNKKFGEARAALDAMTSAEIAVENERLEEARRQKNNYSATDPTQNKDAIEKEIRATQRISELQERRAKELEKINREEAKVSYRRSFTTAKSERDRLGVLLNNADGNTPQKVIDQAMTRYNELQAQLLDLLEVRQRLEGDQNELSEEQLEEERSRLRSFQSQNNYLELLFRREQTVRDNLLLQLDQNFTSGDLMKDARARELGIEPGSRTARAGYLQGRAGALGQLIKNDSDGLINDRDLLEKNRLALLNDPANEELQKQQRELDASIRRRTADLQTWREELGDIELRLTNIQTNFRGALDAAFDLDTIRLGLEQSSSSIEGLSFRIHDTLIAGIEGIGDAFADALLEGEDFIESLDSLLIDTGKDILRDLIKTYTTETISGFLKVLTPSGKAEAEDPNAVASPIGTVGGLVSKAFGWLTGSESTPAAAGAAGSVAGAVDGCCCKGPGDLVEAGKSLFGGKNSPLADAAEGESKGFFDSLLGGFGDLLDTLTGGFGKAIGGLASIFTGGASGGVGAGISLFAGLLGFKKGGIIRAATGGIIRGRGTGTSDSIPGLVRASNGTLRPILTSNGESILNAKATSLLGESGVHALNSGQLVQANTSQMNREIGALMRNLKTGGGMLSPAVGGNSKVYKTTQLSVTPAQMRMRMGDWLEQHTIEELSNR